MARSQGRRPPPTEGSMRLRTVGAFRTAGLCCLSAPVSFARDESAFLVAAWLLHAASGRLCRPACAKRRSRGWQRRKRLEAHTREVRGVVRSKAHVADMARRIELRVEPSKDPDPKPCWLLARRIPSVGAASQSQGLNDSCVEALFPTEALKLKRQEELLRASEAKVGLSWGSGASHRKPPNKHQLKACNKSIQKHGRAAQ